MYFFLRGGECNEFGAVAAPQQQNEKVATEVILGASSVPQGEF